MKRIAYLILAHSDTEMLLRLLKSLDYKADFYVHIDKKGSINIEEVRKKFNKVKFVDRINVFWGGYSMIEATLNLIDAVVESGIKYEKAILLSGQDYPVRSKEYIYNFMSNNPVNYINAFNVSKIEVPEIKKEITHVYKYDVPLFKKNSLLFKISRKVINVFLYGIVKKKNVLILPGHKKRWDIYKGSQWWALNQDVLESFYDFIHFNSDAHFFIKRMKYVFAPDEKFFQTLFFNSSFKKSNLNYGEKDFPIDLYNRIPRDSGIKDTAYMSEFKNIHIISKDLRKIYTLKDYKEIERIIHLNKELLFLRKVRNPDSKSLLDLLDEKNGREHDISSN